MKTKLILLCALLALVVSANARIGETIAQCEARYGKPTAIKPEPDVLVSTAYVYQKNGIAIEIYFLDGKAAKIVFAKTEGGFFSDRETDILLAANAGGSSWKQSLKNKAEWRRADDAAIAGNGGTFALTISAKPYWEKQKQYVAEQERREIEAENKRLEGF